MPKYRLQKGILSFNDLSQGITFVQDEVIEANASHTINRAVKNGVLELVVEESKKEAKEAKEAKETGENKK